MVVQEQTRMGENKLCLRLLVPAASRNIVYKYKLNGTSTVRV